ncbi:MAG: calcium-binding protein [Roseibium sp.]
MTGDDRNDVLLGGDGNDVIDGGDGNDILSGGAGADTLVGGAGNDWAFYNSSAVGVTVDLSDTLAEVGGDAQGDQLSGIENLRGSEVNDVLVGDSNNNTLNGGAGNDILSGGAGNDTLISGTGTLDSLVGGAGNDSFFDQSAGTVVMDGGAGSVAFYFDGIGVATIADTSGTADTTAFAGMTSATFSSGQVGDDLYILMSNELDDGSLDNYAVLEDWYVNMDKVEIIILDDGAFYL